MVVHDARQCDAVWPPMKESFSTIEGEFRGYFSGAQLCDEMPVA